jgi:hypothetical protein
MNTLVKISGVTIVKNAVDFDYPIVESIKSLLPIVDEMIVSIGDGHDTTEEVIRAINSSKIKIVHSIWDKTLKTGGSVLAVETNKVLQHVAKDSDWIFYLQADEVIHEQDYAAITAATQQYKGDKKVEGFLFQYHHFYGSFDFIGDSRRWYNYEIRIIRNNLPIQSYRDAQGFRIDNKKLKVKKIKAHIYHYGWVRTPLAQLKKLANFGLYWGESEVRPVADDELFDYINSADSLAAFKGTHPNVMAARIERNNWPMEFDTRKKRFSFKYMILYRLEKLTGKRLFDYRNYKVI